VCCLPEGQSGGRVHTIVRVLLCSLEYCIMSIDISRLLYSFSFKHTVPLAFLWPPPRARLPLSISPNMCRHEHWYTSLAPFTHNTIGPYTPKVDFPGRNKWFLLSNSHVALASGCAVFQRGKRGGHVHNVVRALQGDGKAWTRGDRCSTSCVPV
jgi:hypothetical protein